MKSLCPDPGRSSRPIMGGVAARAVLDVMEDIRRCEIAARPAYAWGREAKGAKRLNGALMSSRSDTDIADDRARRLYPQWHHPFV